MHWCDVYAFPKGCACSSAEVSLVGLSVAYVCFISYTVVQSE